MSRTRTRNLPIPTTVTVLTHGAGGNLLSTQGGLYNHTSWSETMTDTLTPGYFGSRRRGKFLNVNTMTHTKYEKEQSSSTGFARWKLYDLGASNVFLGSRTFSGELALGRQWATGLSTFPSWTGSEPSVQTEAQLSTEALAKARTQGFDMLTFVAEWHKTVELIKGFRTRTLFRAERVAGALTRKSGKHSKPIADTAEAFAETWLEGRYGWRILRYDIEQINKSLTRLNEIRSGIIRASAESSATVSRTVYNTTTAAGLGIRTTPTSSAPSAYGIYSVIQNRTYTRRCGVLLDAIVGDILSIDPLVTAYEVIPFSFILDWFVNIGDVVAAYSPFATENLLGAWTSFKEEVQTQTFYNANGPSTKKSYGGYYMLLDVGGTWSSSVLKTTYTRSPISPSVGLTWDLRLDAAKLTDLASIFVLRYLGVLSKISKLNRI